MELPKTIRRNVSVDAETFFQREPMSTRIRINRGDRVQIRASGTVRWTNWNMDSNPDGLPNQGNYRGIQSGTLCAQIGNSGKPIKIGSGESFVASEAGTLYLAIAVQDNYANQNSYRWTGSYKVKIVVDPR